MNKRTDSQYEARGIKLWPYIKQTMISNRNEKPSVVIKAIALQTILYKRKHLVENGFQAEPAFYSVITKGLQF